MNKPQAYAHIKNVRISPKKVAPVMDLVRGRDIMYAKRALAFDSTRAAKVVLKALKSAEANAKNKKGIKVSDMFVSEIYVGGGRSMKSGQFVGRGRFNPILKRTSHIFIGLNEKGASKK